MNGQYDENFRHDIEYIRHRKQIRNLRKEKREQAFYLKITAVIAIGLAIILIYACVRIGSLNKQVNDLSIENEQLTEELVSVSNEFNDLSALLYETSDIAISLDHENTELLNYNYELTEIVDSLEERQELYNKYEYALIREDGTRTDITFEHIKSLKDLAIEKGLNDQVIDLILSIVMTESDGYENAKNSKSTASGFGQFLSTTGTFVYERLMNMDEYSHDMAMNGSLNLEMMTEYLCYLNDKYNGNMDLVINEYRGLDSNEYKNKINHYLANSDLSLTTISIK